MTKECQTAIEIVKAGENVRHDAGPGSTAWRELSIHRLEALYEVAFLRAFISWEMCQEQLFYRYLCGFTASFGAEIPKASHHYRTLADAEIAVLGKSLWKSWFSPTQVIARCQQHIVNGRMEALYTANQVRLENLAAIRHRIAHGQSDAKNKFMAATQYFTLRPFGGTRPGRFLRAWHPTLSPQTRWLEALIDELAGFAKSLV